MQPKPFIKGKPQLVVDPRPGGKRKPQLVVDPKPLKRKIKNGEKPYPMPSVNDDLVYMNNFKNVKNTRMGTGIVGKDGRNVNKLYQTP